MSILDQTESISRNQRSHDCGGTILWSSSNGESYYYCDTCGAFRYESEGEGLPTGVDPAANRSAWDAGNLESPDAK